MLIRSRMQQNHEERAYENARKVLRSLLLEVDPDTHERLSSECVITQPDVKTALALGIEALQTTQWVRRWRQRDQAKAAPACSSAPSNALAKSSTPARVRAGEAWTSIEDQDLQYGFHCGRSLGELCEHHGRTDGAIFSRLVRLGLVPSKQEARDHFRHSS